MFLFALAVGTNVSYGSDVATTGKTKFAKLSIPLSNLQSNSIEQSFENFASCNSFAATITSEIAVILTCERFCIISNYVSFKPFAFHNGIKQKYRRFII